MFGIFIVFTNCEQEQFEPETYESKYVVQRIYSNEISSNETIKTILKGLNKSKSKTQSSQHSREVYDGEYGFTVGTDEATYIEHENYHSYTFQIYRDDNSDLTENLVLSLQNDLTYKVFIVSYSLTEEEKEALLNNDQLT